MYIEQMNKKALIMQNEQKSTLAYMCVIRHKRNVEKSIHNFE